MSIPHIVLTPLWAIFLIVAFMNQTIITNEVLSIVSRSQSATVLSVQNLLRRCVYALIIPGLGVLSDSIGLKGALLWYALFMFIVFCLVIMMKPPPFRDIIYKQNKP